MTTDARDDAELLAAWQAGDQIAGRALVRSHTPTLHRFFASKAPDAIEDLVQGVFIVAVESKDRFRGESSFRTYLLAIARRLLLKRYRKRMRGDKAMALERITAAAVSGSPSFVAAAREELRLLLSALRRIPIDHQIAIELYYWEDLAVSEIAGVLEIAPGTVKSRLSRAREQLRAQIDALDGDPSLRRATDDPSRWAAEVRAHCLGTDSGDREPRNEP